MPSRDSQTVNRIDVAGPTALGDAVAAMRRYAVDQGLAPTHQARLCIIVEELITNMIEHGGGERRIGLQLDRQGDAVRVAIEDDGPAFDPRDFADSAIPERGGGAGLRLVRIWAESIAYQSSGGRNRLELFVPLKAE